VLSKVGIAARRFSKRSATLALGLSLLLSSKQVDI